MVELHHRYPEADALLREALWLQERYSGAAQFKTLYHLGIVVRKLKRYDDSEAFLERALQVNKQHQVAH